uniref:Uncharacterized protein n=1 Tax=Rhizophora mucronata TaxID=61149 RepID=A0A2P2JG21_RHIMU
MSWEYKIYHHSNHTEQFLHTHTTKDLTQNKTEQTEVLVDRDKPGRRSGAGRWY